MRQQLSRRHLLTLALAGTLPRILVACGGGSAPVPSIAAPPSRTLSDLSEPSTAPPPPPAPTSTPRVPVPLLLNPQFRPQDTPATNALSPDGYTWAQGRPIVVDRHDAIIAVAQKVGIVGGMPVYAHVFIFSNDAGTTWREASLEVGGLSRGSLAYDDQNDIVHALWIGQNEIDAVVYRRYTIERDPDGAVQDIHAEPTGDCRLDGRTGEAVLHYAHPIISWLAAEELGNRHGAVLCVWSAHSGAPGQGGNEVRASLRLLDNTSADADANSWVAPGAPSSPTLGGVPAVPYTALAINSAATPIYPALGRKRAGRHAGDLYLFYADGGGGQSGAHRWCWRRFAWRASDQRWAPGTEETAISPISRAGRDQGYESKGQLGTKVVEDPRSGRMFFGFTTWKDDAAGDTWCFTYATDDDSLGPLVDVYSCGGRFQPELYALTGDLAFDDEHNRLVVAYVQSGEGRNRGLLRVYDGAAPTEPETSFFSAADVDIPLLWQDPRTGQCRYSRDGTDRLLVLFRDTNGQAPPYRGWFGTLDWAT
jgi:hypothetical protein